MWALVVCGTGALIASRHPENPIGWLFCGFALVNVLGDVAQGWGLRAAAEGWPAGPAGEWIATWSWLPSGLGWMLTFLLFPDGRLPGRGWRVVAWARGAGMVLAIAGWSLYGAARRRSSRAATTRSRSPASRRALLVTVGMTLFLGALLASGGLPRRCGCAARGASSASSSSGSSSRPPVAVVVLPAGFLL